jgi:outer membrane cobalamin receptor
VTPSSILAQWPGELRVTVTDAYLGAPVSQATVEIPGLRFSGSTDGAGQLSARGLHPGGYVVLIRRVGYLDVRETVEVRNGRVSHLVISLTPEPIALGEVDVTAGRRELLSYRIEGSRIPQGARTLGDILAAAPGLLVRSQGPGGKETISLRGGGADDVLVLLDGIPLNDPITGEADVSRIPARAVERVTILRGGHAASLGPRAQAGAVVISTRTSAPGLQADLMAGSLSLFGLAGSAGLRWQGMSLGVDVNAQLLHGGFRYLRPSEVGGGVGWRENADSRRISVRGNLLAAVAGGDLRVSGGWEELERGLPGKSYAPSPFARQRTVGGSASARWERRSAAGLDQISLFNSIQTTDFTDSAPPLGLAYDDRSRVLTTGFAAEISRDPGVKVLGFVGGGIDARHQRVTTNLLDDRAPGARTDLGIFLKGEGNLATEPGRLQLAAVGRAQRDGVTGSWIGAHELTLSSRIGVASIHVSHRSSYSPPSLGDQFFREGIGVEPNPSLAAERVPSEVEVGGSVLARWRSLGSMLGVDLYRGDVRGMIVWAPDFRFVWSPRNVDVKRWGAELWGQLDLRPLGIELSGTYSRTSVVYDWPGPNDSVQVAYRPRNAGAVEMHWSVSRWEVMARARFVGTRYPVPARVNALPGFWTIDTRVCATLPWGGIVVVPYVVVDRLLDRTDSMIFGYPEPGRLFEIGLSIGPRRPGTFGRDAGVAREEQS